MKKKFTINHILLMLGIVMAGVILWVFYLYNIIPHAIFRDENFNILFDYSELDQNNNDIDDFVDILQGAKAEVQRNPAYHSAYYQGGYPPDDEGVCTDIIWRSLKEAGYDLKQLLDDDIVKCISCYARVQGKPDPNIDFRRVPNLQVFLQRHTQSLTIDLAEIDQWQAGDIVIFSDSHVGIISDLRNYKGVPFLIHNGGLPKMEEDALWREDFLKGISGHYRFRYHE